MNIISYPQICGVDWCLCNVDPHVYVPSLLQGPWFISCLVCVHLSNTINDSTKIISYALKCRFNSRFIASLNVQCTPDKTSVSVISSSKFGTDKLSLLVWHYSIHIPGWLLKWLNLITAPGSVSNEPGSVTWLATKYLKTVSWRNHTENLTTLQPQNISFWPKINISSSYFTILILICLENTLKLLFDSCVKSVKFKTNWLDQIPTLLESSESWLRYGKITHRYAKDSPFTWFLYLKLPIDTDFIHSICQFHQSCGIKAREYFKGQLHLSKACWELWLSDGQPHSDYNGQW